MSVTWNYSSTLDKIAHIQNNTKKRYKTDIDFQLLDWGGKEGDVNIWSNERPILEDRIDKKNRQLEKLLLYKLWTFGNLVI